MTTTTATTERTQFLSMVMPNGWMYSACTDGNSRFDEQYGYTEVVIYRDEAGSLRRVEMAGFKKQDGSRPGLFHAFVDDKGRVRAVHNDAYHTEKNTKLYRAFITAVESINRPAV